MPNGCCGHPVPRRRRPMPQAAPMLPPNPRVPDGVRLLYLGGGPQKLRGPATGLSYYVSEHRRAFTAPAEDARAFARRRDVILAP